MAGPTVVRSGASTSSSSDSTAAAIAARRAAEAARRAAAEAARRAAEEARRAAEAARQAELEAQRQAEAAREALEEAQAEEASEAELAQKQADLEAAELAAQEAREAAMVAAQQAQAKSQEAQVKMAAANEAALVNENEPPYTPADIAAQGVSTFDASPAAVPGVPGADPAALPTPEETFDALSADPATQVVLEDLGITNPAEFAYFSGAAATQLINDDLSAEDAPPLNALMDHPVAEVETVLSAATALTPPGSARAALAEQLNKTIQDDLYETQLEINDMPPGDDRDDALLAQAARLPDLVALVPADYREDLLVGMSGTIQTMTTGVGELNDEETDQFVASMAQTFNIAGEGGGIALAHAFANTIAVGELQGSGTDAFGNEQQFIDAFDQTDTEMGAFRAAFATELHGFGGEENIRLAALIENSGNVNDALTEAEEAYLADQALLVAVENAEENVSAAVAAGDPIAASDVLADELEGLPPESRGDLLIRVAQDVDTLLAGTTDLDREQTAQVVGNLTRAAESAGPLHAPKITDPIARAIANQSLEQTGTDANSGLFGFNKGGNTHNSEREFVEGIEDGSLFQSALTVSLEEQGLSGFAGAVATKSAEDIPDDNYLTWITQVDEHGRDAINDATEWLATQQAEFLNGFLDDSFNVTESITDDNLHPGDSISFDAGLSVAAGISGGSEGNITVERNEDGSYTVRGAGGFDVGLGVGNYGSVEGGAGAAMEFTFGSAAEAQRGTLALLRYGSQAAALAATSTTPLTWPAAAGVAVAGGLDLFQGEDSAFLDDHISAIELNAGAAGSLSADLGFGLTDVFAAGVSGDVETGYTARIEFENGDPSAILFSQSVGASVSGELSNPAIGIPDAAIEGVTGRDLGEFGNGGAASTSVTGTIEFRVPLETNGAPLAEVLATPGRFADVDAATASFLLEQDYQGGSQGIHFEVEVPELSVEEGLNVAEGLATGNLNTAFDGWESEANVSWHTFENIDSGGELSFVVGSANASKVTQHVGDEHSAGVTVTGDEEQLQFAVTNGGDEVFDFDWTYPQ